jgi:hypothetical protein
MSTVEVPMYRENGTRVQIKDLFAKVPVNDWVWSILEFDGVGQMPSNESISEFQKKLREQFYGMIMTWSEIVRFADAVEYTIDCLIVAVSHIEQLNVDELMADNFLQCEIAIRAVDSTEWILAASNRSLLDDLESTARGA